MLLPFLINTSLNPHYSSSSTLVSLSIMQFTTTYMLLFVVFSTIAMALPIVVETRDVYAPPVLYPNANTIWKVGSKHNVTW